MFEGDYLKMLDIFLRFYFSFIVIFHRVVDTNFQQTIS